MARAKKVRESPEEWVRALEVEEALKPIIEEFHPHLANARILCFLKPKNTKSKNRLVIAKAMKATPILRAALQLSGAGAVADYLIVIGRMMWVTLSPETQKAVLDHELMHFTGRDDKGRWGLQGHAIEEFVEILERRGAYTFELRQFVKVAKQLELTDRSASVEEARA